MTSSSPPFPPSAKAPVWCLRGCIRCDDPMASDELFCQSCVVWSQDYDLEGRPMSESSPPYEPSAEEPKRPCRECGEPLSEARAALGLTLCSGRCHAAARGWSQACGARPDHLWQITGGEGWRCLYCSRITDDVALVRAGLTAQIAHSGRPSAPAPDGA